MVPYNMPGPCHFLVPVFFTLYYGHNRRMFVVCGITGSGIHNRIVLNDCRFNELGRSYAVRFLSRNDRYTFILTLLFPTKC